MSDPYVNFLLCPTHHTAEAIDPITCRVCSLQDALSRLTAERDALSNLVGQMRPEMEKLAALETTIANLREALRKYGRHTMDTEGRKCLFRIGADCICGLTTAIEAND